MADTRGLRLSTYFVSVLVITTALMFLISARVAVAYGIASALLLLPLHSYRGSARGRTILLFSAAWIWVTHLIRTFFLAAEPEHFKFPVLGEVSQSLLATSLLLIGVYGFAMMMGLRLGTRLTFGFPVSKFALSRNGQPLLLFARPILTVLMIIAVIVRSVLQAKYGVLDKSGESANQAVAFVVRFTPEFLIYALAVLYVWRYRHVLTFIQRLPYYACMALPMILSMAGGSKGFIARFAIVVFLFFLVEKGDFRIRPARAVTVVFGLALVIILSFNVANLIRRNKVETPTDAILAATTELVSNPDALVLGLNLVTHRLNGLDGFIGTRMHRPRKLTEVFSPVPTFKRMIARLLPYYVAGGGQISSGKAISIAYHGLPVERKHTGSVGLFGALSLMLGQWLGIVGIFAIGILFALLCKLGTLFNDSDMELLFMFLGLQTIAGWLVASGLEFNAALAINNVALITAIAFFAVFFSAPMTYRASARVSAAQAVEAEAH